MTETPQDIALIELHDSVVEVLEYRGSGVRIGFERLYVFRRLAPDLYDVWSYRAAMAVDGVSDVSIDGAITDGWISDATVEWRHKRFDVTEVLGGGDVDLITITLRSGTRIQIRGQRARIDLQEPLEKVEQWSGPLMSTLPPEG